MKTRGRTSRASTEIAQSGVGQIEVIKRPEPPLDLTPNESDVWVETVNALPADWFPRETWPLLRQWCRHTVSAHRVSQLIDACAARDEVDVTEMGALLAMQARETSALKAMASAMRLSQQASYSARGAGGTKGKRTMMDRPWDE